MRKHWDTAVVALIAAFAGWQWMWLNDVGAGGHPWVWTGVYVGLFSVIMLPFVLWRFKRTKLGISIAFLLWSVLLLVVPTTSRDFFVRDLHSIEPGMTARQVDAVMKPYANRRYESEVGSSETWLPREFKTADRLVSFRHSDDGAYNADVGEVYLRRGRVLGTRFLPD